MMHLPLSRVALLCLLLASPAAAADNAADARREMAQTLVGRMSAGEFAAAVGPFDAAMQKALPPSKLAEVWEAITGQYGNLKQTSDIRTEKLGQYQAVLVTCEFQRGKLAAKVVFDAENKVAGLFFVPAGKYQPPSYAQPDKFREVEITIGSGLFRLPGTLSIPQGKGPHPAIVLVHGSGPHDRDETIGPNKPFRDLAHGLASRGIAVFRYEKRTKHHQLAMAALSGNITVEQETVDDAAHAVAALAKREEINPGKIFVLGHSLGGMLIPRIATKTDLAAGYICLAGNTRPLEDLVLDQTNYLLAGDGNLTEVEQKALDEIKQQVDRIKSGKFDRETPRTELPLSVPPSYWLDLRKYRPAEAAKKVKQPMLFLQGERDYQVTMEDFAGWKQALRDRDNVKFLSYPKLNHLFMTGDGKSRPAEYMEPGNVSEAVIRDIAEWVTGGA